LDVDTVARVANDYIGFNESLREGRLLKDYKPDAIVNKQLLSIASMLHNGSLQLDIDDEPIVSKENRGLFSWFSRFKPKVDRSTQSKALANSDSIMHKMTVS
jgi:pilus assembly protein CpaE